MSKACTVSCSQGWLQGAASRSADFWTCWIPRCWERWSYVRPLLARASFQTAFLALPLGIASCALWRPTLLQAKMAGAPCATLLTCKGLYAVFMLLGGQMGFIARALRFQTGVKGPRNVLPQRGLSEAFATEWMLCSVTFSFLGMQKAK